MVHATAGDGLGGRRLRVGMVGGGRNAFIGAVHRMAMRLDDLIELMAGALSADPENARALRRRSRARARPRLFRLSRDGGARGGAAGRHRGRRHRHARTICTIPSPRRSSRPASTSSATSRCRRRWPRRRNWSSSRAPTGLVFAVTLNNTGYPMVRQAREMIAAGELGDAPRRARGLYPGLADPADRRRRAQAGGMAHRSRPRRRFGLPRRHRRARAQSRAVRHRARTRRGRGGPDDLRARPAARRQRACAAALRRRRARRAGREPGRGRQSQQSEPEGLWLAAAGSNGPARRRRLLRFTPYGEPTRTLAARRPGQHRLADEGSRMPAGHPGGLYRGLRQSLSRRGGTDRGPPRGPPARQQRAR